MALIWKMNRDCLASKESRKKHIDHALSLELPEFFPSVSLHPFLEEFESEPISICASGPSLLYHVDDITRPIMAINKAHDFLIKRGIQPDYAVSIDPQQDTWECFSLADENVQYFLASQCHPDFFKHLDKYKVTLFHLLGEMEKTHLKSHRCFFVGGGSTSGLRAMTLAYLMGYRKQKLFGYDSCYLNGNRNIDKPMQGVRLPIEVNEKEFITNMEFAAQADEFQDVLLSMDHCQVQAFGEGVIAEIMKARKQYLGCKHAASTA